MIRVTIICDFCEREFAGFTMDFLNSTPPEGANLGKVINHKGHHFTLCDKCHEKYIAVMQEANAKVDDFRDEAKKAETKNGKRK